VFGVSVDGGANKYVAADDYFWHSQADEGPQSLRAAFQTLLTNAPNAVASTTVTIDDATGIMTITWGSGSHSLAWANTTVRNRCGATADFGAATTLVMPGQVKGLWLPNVLGSNNGTVTGPGLPESDRKVTLSRSGAVWATSNSERRRVKFQFRGLSKAKMCTADETTTNSSLETFWRDSLNYRAGVFRHHPDRTVDNVYTTWASLMTTGLRPTRLKGAYDSVWDSGELEAIQYVHVERGGGF
jgi:hypothetical protein